MADMYAVSGETLTSIADAIRSKTGSDEQMTVAAMASAIEGISEGGIESEMFSYNNPNARGGTWAYDAGFIVSFRKKPIFITFVADDGAINKGAAFFLGGDESEWFVATNGGVFLSKRETPTGPAYWYDDTSNTLKINRFSAGILWSKDSVFTVTAYYAN